MTAAEFKAKRLRLRLTQKELAKVLGLSKRAIQNYESGERPVKKHLAMAVNTLRPR